MALVPTKCTSRRAFAGCGQSAAVRREGAIKASKQSVDTATTELKQFFETLKETLKAPDASNFEPAELMKELKDTDQLGKRGELFVLGQFALIILVVFPAIDIHLPLQLLGFLSIGLGGSVIVAGSNSLGKSLTPLPAPRKSGTLVTDGMFKHMRHPLYAGLIFGSFGLSALTLDASRALFAVCLTVLLSYTASYEEARLVDKFGADYEKYMASVKRFGLF
jgi:protein-S-isoprenylcysteine O-methyltransferase Ste14